MNVMLVILLLGTGPNANQSIEKRYPMANMEQCLKVLDATKIEVDSNMGNVVMTCTNK